MQVHADADFAGTWNLSESDLLESALSRAGYVKNSKLSHTLGLEDETEVALSTTEADHVALSKSTRDLLLVKQML